jgi:iron complex transport system substrate-binding protein
MGRNGLLATLLLAACAPAAPPPGVAHPAIVSLNPCSDAVLAEIAPAETIALSHYSFDAASSSMDPAAARRFRRVGDSAEDVLVLRPDLVIASSYIAPATAAALTDAGIKVERLPIARNVTEARAQVRRLAALAGRRAAGEVLVARIDAALARAVPPAGATPVSALVWQSGGIVPGKDTLIADLLRRTGFASHSAARGMRQAELLPLEDLIAEPPQLILAAGDPASGEDRMLSHPALAALPGTRRERLDPSLLWCGGPTIIRAAERLAAVRRSFETRTGLRQAQSGPLLRMSGVPKSALPEEGLSGARRAKTKARLEG